MPDDSTRVADEVTVALNPAEPVPDRPADSAVKVKWVDYGVALGLHPDTASEMTRDDLVGVTKRLT